MAQLVGASDEFVEVIGALNKVSQRPYVQGGPEAQALDVAAALLRVVLADAATEELADLPANAAGAAGQAPLSLVDRAALEAVRAGVSALSLAEGVFGYTLAGLRLLDDVRMVRALLAGKLAPFLRDA